MNGYKYILLIIIIVCYNLNITAQTKAELEEQRRKTLQEIEFTDNLLTNTAKEKTESVKSLRILGSKVSLRENVLRNMGNEISILNSRIELNQLAVEMMENDLRELKQDYARNVVNSYKAQKVNPDIVFVLSAKDFNQGYKRLQYLKQATRFRRNEAELIQELKFRIEESKLKLEDDLMSVMDLKQKEEYQKRLLQEEQAKKQRMIKSLTNKEKQLQKELAEKKKLAQRIDGQIAKLIEEEKKRVLKTNLTPEQKLIGDNFAENKGRLPWPTEKGVITSRFGVHQHPVLKYVTEENFGVEISGSGKTMVRSVFKGTVSAITSIPGANMTVIIRHGKYLTVYTNLINVKVKTGESVDTKQEIGEIFIDPGPSGTCTLRFMIFDEKYVDPELWIAKNSD
jgi:septal ring factor EnvC (AmiA/AmiB activator)